MRLTLCSITFSTVRTLVNIHHSKSNHIYDVYYLPVIKVKDNTSLIRTMYTSCPINLPESDKQFFNTISIREREIVEWLLYDEYAHINFLTNLEVILVLSLSQLYLDINQTVTDNSKYKMKFFKHYKKDESDERESKETSSTT